VPTYYVLLAAGSSSAALPAAPDSKLTVVDILLAVLRVADLLLQLPDVLCLLAVAGPTAFAALLAALAALDVLELLLQASAQLHQILPPEQRKFAPPRIFFLLLSQ